MEVDSNSSNDKAADVSDEMRLDASTRLRTLTPLHDDIAANDMPEETIVTQNIIQGPIANVANDSETTTAFSQDKQTVLAKKTNATALIIGLVVAIAAGAAAIFVFVK